MRIVISGASGFIGKSLCEHFISQGHDIIKIQRSHYKLNIHIFKELFRETDVLINLSGEPVVKRWTRRGKRRIYSSRIDTTKKIITAFTLLKYRPRLFISASATGIYNFNETKHTETSTDFASNNIAELVKAWEDAIAGVNNLVDVRLIIMRLGVVIGKKSSAFQKMKNPYYWGLGGRIGNGRQYFPIIHIEDVINAVDFFIENKTTSGIYNLSIPEPVTNRDFSKTMGKILHSPSFMIIPEFMLKIIYGKGANALIKGAHVLPKRLLSEGYTFLFPDAEKVITQALKKKPRELVVETKS